MVLIEPAPPRLAWRARFRDPDTGRLAYESLDPLGAGRTHEARRGWAIAKAEALARRKDALKLGAPLAKGLTIRDAVERWFEDHPQARPRTVSTYRRHANSFLAWCTREGIAKADALTADQLRDYRASRMRSPKRAATTRNKRGARHETPEPRSPVTVNVELRSVRTVLGYARSLRMLARLTSDDLRDGLKRYPEPNEAPAFLRPSAIKALLRAALDHDADTFRLTRAENAVGRSRPQGVTPRHEPIAPYVATVLLSGMRSGEAHGRGARARLVRGRARGRRGSDSPARTACQDQACACGGARRITPPR